MRGLYIVHKIIQKSFRALFHKILSLDGWVWSRGNGGAMPAGWRTL